MRQITQRDKNSELLTKLRETLGDTALLDELVHNTMSAQEACDNLEHIARMWDIETGEEG